MNKFTLAFTVSAAALLASATPSAAATCLGNCGTLGANGSVPAPPSGSTYSYVSSNGGVSGAGQISGVGGTNGSSFTTDVFSAAVGDPLNFYFNYITSDGTSSFPDYGFAQLLTAADVSVGYLFTARTVVNPGNTSPGFGLPLNISTLTPATTAIQGGLTTWSALGGSSGQCFQGVGNGCGSTGWIKSVYSITTAGSYKIRFGVSNFGDTQLDSGLAFSGITIAGTPVNPTGGVPEPATWLSMIVGFGMLGGALRRRQQTSVRYA